MIRQIVKIGDNLLREKSLPITIFDNDLHTLIDDMFETMLEAQGVGLAAPQIGILRRIAVVSTDGRKKYELINPVIIKKSGKQSGAEGCLSVPNVHGIVERPKKLIVEAFDRYGKKQVHRVDGFTAVAFCHEMDHLDGTLFIDKMIAEEECE